jgi:hypothetical protein
MMFLWEFSYGYRFKLVERIRVGPFAGLTLYGQGPEPSTKADYAAAAGLHLELKAYKHLQLYTRAHCIQPFYHMGEFINPFASALLYITVGAGYTFID